MGNRKQPFGYRMTLGEITILPEEAETVRSIYLQYIAGISFKQLAEQLQAEDVPYDEDKSWNKNMVSRILEDDRYIGKEEFPALITAEQFHAAQKRREEMRPAYKQTPAQKTLRRLCGAPPSERVEKIVTDLLNELIRWSGSPLMRTTPKHCSFNWRQSSTTPSGTRNTKPCGCGGCSPVASP